MLCLVFLLLMIALGFTFQFHVLHLSTISMLYQAFMEELYILLHGLFLDITSWNGYLYNFCFLTNEYFFKTSLYFNVWRQHQTFGTYLIAMLFSNLCLNSMKFLKNTLNIKFKTNRIAFCTERVWTNTAVSNILTLVFHWSATDLYYHCFSVFISFFVI